MSTPFAERPPGRVRKYFCSKVLRHFYVTFVSSDRRAQDRSRAKPEMKFFTLLSRG